MGNSFSFINVSALLSQTIRTRKSLNNHETQDSINPSFLHLDQENVANIEYLLEELNLLDQNESQCDHTQGLETLFGNDVLSPDMFENSILEITPKLPINKPEFVTPTTTPPSPDMFENSSLSEVLSDTTQFPNPQTSSQHSLREQEGAEASSNHAIAEDATLSLEDHTPRRRNHTDCKIQSYSLRRRKNQMKKSFLCPISICKQRFWRARDFDGHRLMHLNLNRNLGDIDIDKACPSPSSMKICHYVQNKNSANKESPKDKPKSRLVKKVSPHTLRIRERPFPCDKCGKCFTRHCHLSAHDKAVHLKIKYSCPQCGKQFAGSSSMKRHIDVVHLGIRYICSKCYKEFTSNYYCRRHEYLCY